MIRIVNLHKKFGETEILKGLSIEIKEGEVLAIIGPSGSGKSTFLRCLNFLEEAEQGILEIDGISVNFAKKQKAQVSKIRSKTGMVFQNYNCAT
jgi:putative S-methylcysteine transport system ATP-binding protein